MTLEQRTETIQRVLADCPQLETYEDVVDECVRQGADVGIWSVYFVAKSVGRQLQRRQETVDKQALCRELALTLWACHHKPADVFATMDQLQELNSRGERIPWETEKLQPKYTWELSIAQELSDECGGIEAARNLLCSL